MLKIGSHVSFRKDTQLLGSLDEALSYGSTTFMFYTGAPQNTNRIPLNSNLTKMAISKMKDNNIDIKDIIVHAPYIINLANSDPNKYIFSINFLKQECKRCEELGVNKLVLHPGSHVGLGEEAGIKNIINALNQILPATKTTILLETMSGKGTELGVNLEQIKTIIDGVKYNNIGICLDTCHLSDAGYDMNDFDSLLDKMDKMELLDLVGCIHINDSKNPIGSHKDRHENIGFGYLGFDILINIIYNDRLKNISKILETPYVGEFAPYKLEIDMIKNKKFEKNLKEMATLQ
ncbi:MAG: deoxyribonuclease IV [Bacilli bacterium]|nr:deoxyribonuclease IV [Bacilli bacterium]